MLRFARWKIVSILAMTLAAILVIVPSLLSKESFTALKAAAPRWLPIEQVVLGLDLQGGAHIMLEVDQADVVKTQVANLRDDVRRVLREENARLSGGIGAQGRAVQFRVPDPADRARVLPKLRGLGQGSVNSLGSLGQPAVDLSEDNDGLIRMSVTDAGVNDKVRRAVDQAIEVLRRRIDALGTTEPNIQRQGDDRVLVQVPGLQDTARLKELLGTTAKLEFRLVADPGYDPSDVELLPQTDQPGAISGRETRDGAGRGPHRRAARLRFAHVGARGEFSLQHTRRPAFWRSDVGQCRQALRDRARQ